MHNKLMKNSLMLNFLILVLALPLLAATLKTPAEETGFTRYSQHADIVRFLSSVAFLSKNVSIQVVGKTLAVADFPAQDIFLVVLTEEKAAHPGELNRNKATVLLIASQHGNEQSAKESTLQLIRDLALGELKPLLRQVNFLVIPQTNPHGNGYDQRENELDLDLNRDHVKLESEGAQTIHRVFRTWMPEVTLDIHERGDNYYRVAIGCVSNSNIHPRIQEYSRHQVLARVEKILDQHGITFHEYLVTEEMGLNTAAGANLGPKDTTEKEMLVRYSTTDLNDGRNSLGIYQTLSFIQEGASRHDLKTLKQRTHWQTMGLHAFVKVIADQRAEILTLVQELRENLIRQAQAYSEDNRVHLKLQYTRDENNPTITIKEFKKTDSLVTGVMKVDRNAGDVLKESDVAPYPFPDQYQVVTRVVKNWFPRVEPIVSIARPLGYIIPAKHSDVIAILLLHGIAVSFFTQDCQVAIKAYQISNISPAKYDYLPPDTIAVQEKAVQLLVKRGDFFISCAQPAASLIPCLLEPQSDYGLIRYWKLKLVPEKGDFFAFYRLIQDQNLSVIPYQRW